MNVQELMNQPAITCRATASLNTAAQLMWEHDCGAVPVVNGDGNVVGMITDRDICMAAYTQGKSLDAISVAHAMAKSVFTIHPHDPIDSAERLMSEKQIRRMPVVDGDNRPVGMLSLNDIARAATSRKKSGLDREVTQTLAAIGQPRPQSMMTQSQPAQLSAQPHQPAAM